MDLFDTRRLTSGQPMILFPAQVALDRWRDDLALSDPWKNIYFDYFSPRRAIVLTRLSSNKKSVFFRTPGWDEEGWPEPGSDKNLIVHMVRASSGSWWFSLSRPDPSEGLVRVFSMPTANIDAAYLDRGVLGHESWVDRFTNDIENYGKRHGIRALTPIGFGDFREQARLIQKEIALGTPANSAKVRAPP
jgi:hypothetical protein